MPANLTPNPFPMWEGGPVEEGEEQNLESRCALYEDPHLHPLPYRERGTEVRGPVVQRGIAFAAQAGLGEAYF